MDDVKILNTVAEDDRNYEMMNGGINPQAFRVVEALGLNRFSIQRFRDAGYDKRRRRMWILTRTGTDSHFPQFHNRGLEHNPYFLKRYDEPKDATYEILLFKLPEHITFKLKHAQLPDLARILAMSLKRFETNQLNPLERIMYERIKEFTES